MRTGWALAGTLLLAGCSGTTEPVVNRLNVSDSQYNRDLAACKQGAGMSVFGSPVSKCLKGKGYQVLMD